MDSPSQQIVNITSAQWKELMQKIENISKVTDEIKDIKLTIKDIQAGLDNVKCKNKDIDKVVNSIHTNTEKLEKRVLEVEKTQDLIALVDSELKATENENKLLKEQLLLQEAYSRRENLVFEGIKETKEENTQETLQSFRTNQLDLQGDCSKMLITRCHRLGAKRNTNRPIIARFVMDSDRHKVWSRKHMLKNTGYFIREDLPGKIVSRRKLMYPMFVNARKKDPDAKIIRDKVTFNKRTYDYSEAYDLAEVLQFYDKGQRKENGYIAFHGRSSFLSNFFPAAFTEGNSVYSCSEQMYQQELCLFFGDAKAARSVMLQTDPVKMKAIGDQMLRSNKAKSDQWFQFHARKVMKSAVHQKFSQNHSIRNQLLQLNGSFAEANQHDCRWGIGLAIHNDDWKDKNKWKGSNWLGEILLEVKDSFKPWL